MNQSNGCGPRSRISVRISSIRAAFPVCVLNAQPAYSESFGVASAQRSSLNCNDVRRVFSHWSLSVGRWRVPWGTQSFVKLETECHISEASTGLSLSATLVFETVVLRAHCLRCSARRRLSSLHLQSCRRSQSAGQSVRLKQTRTNGISQCDPRSQRQDLRPNLR